MTGMQILLTVPGTDSQMDEAWQDEQHESEHDS